MSIVVDIAREAQIKRLDEVEEVLEAFVRAFCHSILAARGRLGRVLLQSAINGFGSEGLVGHHLIKIEILEDLLMQFFVFFLADSDGGSFATQRRIEVLEMLLSAGYAYIVERHDWWPDGSSIFLQRLLGRATTFFVTGCFVSFARRDVLPLDLSQEVHSVFLQLVILQAILLLDCLVCDVSNRIGVDDTLQHSLLHFIQFDGFFVPF